MKSMRRFGNVARKFDNVTTLTKLLLGLFIVVIPLYVINFYINNMGAEKNKKEIFRSLSSTVESYNRLFDADFQQIRQATETYTVDIAILCAGKTIREMHDTQRAATILEIRNMLNNLQKSNRFIKDTRIYIPLLGEMITNHQNSSEALNENEFGIMSQDSSVCLFRKKDDMLLVSSPYVSNNGPSDKGACEFVLAAQMNVGILEDLLGNIINYKSGGALLLSTDQSWSISSRTQLDMAGFLRDSIPRWNQDSGSGTQIHTVVINRQSYIVAYKRSSTLQYALLVYARTDDVFEPLQMYNVSFWIMSFLAVLIIVSISYWLYKAIHKPLLVLVNGFRSVEKGDTAFSLEYSGKSEFGYLFNKFNDMVSRLNVLIHEVYEQQIRSQRIELKRLQAQINPHFLYNNFFVLSRLIYSADTEKAMQFSNYLGRYFQYITRDDEQEVSLAKEAEQARTYTDIQTVCYAGRIRVYFEELPEYAGGIMVPRLILQPVIENSYKHAFENKLHDAQLSVRFIESFSEDSFYTLTVVIEDNGEDLSDSKLIELQNKLDSKKVDMAEFSGLYNVHRRLGLRYGGQSGLQLSRSWLGGLKVEIILRRTDGGKGAGNGTSADC